MNDLPELGLLDEITIGSARGGRRVGKPLAIEVVRTLSEADLPALLTPPPVDTTQRPSLVLQLRHSHHLLARTLASGHSQEAASLITGYSTAYISSLKGDPAFAELLVYYGMQKELIFVDVMERMRVLGLHTLEELQARVTEKPEEFTRRELMELAELMLVKGRSGGGGSGAPGSAAGVNVTVKFVTASEAGPIVDVTPEGEGNG